MIKNNIAINHTLYRTKALNWRNLLLIELILTLGTILQAQVQDLGSPLITNYETEYYKASNQNWAAVQDDRGIMYFGNSLGVLEFDGQHWQLIPTPGNAITRGLASGPDGTIYYGSIGDLGYLAASPTGRVSAVSLREAIPEAKRSFNDVLQVESAADGIYFLTQSRIFRLHNGRITVLPGKFASGQACVLNGTLFYTDSEKGLCLLAGDQVVPIPQLAGVYNGKRITLALFGRHELLAGRISGDFLRINLEPLWDETSQHYNPDRPTRKNLLQTFPSELDTFLNENQALLYKLIPLGQNAFAVSTLKAGIITFDRAGKIIRAINKNSGLKDNTVLGIMMDGASNLWAATNTGISHIELSVPQSLFGSSNGIDGVSICSYLYMGRQYIGTFQNLLVQTPYHFSLKDDHPKYINVKNGPVGVMQFLKTEGDLMAVSGPGLFHIQNETAFKVPGSSTNAYCLGTSRHWPGYLFVGLMGGLEVFRRTSGLWIPVGKIDAIKESIRRITEDTNGDLWLSTEVNGLLRIHFSGSKPTEVVVHGFGPEQGLPGLNDLRASFHGSILYVASPKGLFCSNIEPWNDKRPNWTRFKPAPILDNVFNDPPTALNNMIPDGKGGFLFNTTTGVVWAVSGKDGQLRMFKQPFLGLQAADTFSIHPNGSVWLPGKVLYRVDPWTAKNYDQEFTVLIRKVVARAKHILFEGTHGREGTAFQSQRTIFHSTQKNRDIPELPYNQNALSFDFSATFYEKPGTTIFQYRLEGFTREWSEWSTNTHSEYTNLPEGKYSFRVRAKNLYGTMGHEAGYSLRILPPWYRTWWAYILWVISSISTLITIIYLYTLKLRREKARLEKIVTERTRQLREAVEQLREASLTDPLTGLRNRRFIVEVLQTDIAAFIGLKNFQLTAKNQRGTALENSVFGLFLFDIDFFKKVNDTYGHDAGDRILKQFSTILGTSVRLDDAVMRVGGEEFLVMLKKTRPEYLPLFAAKILKKVAATPFDIGGGTTIQKTCSIGYTSFPFYREQPSLFTFEQCVMVADLGLFHAKNHGRNQGIYLKAGPRLPSGEEIIQKTVSSLEFALQEGYLQIANISNLPSV